MYFSMISLALGDICSSFMCANMLFMVGSGFFWSFLMQSKGDLTYFLRKSGCAAY